MREKEYIGQANDKKLDRCEPIGSAAVKVDMAQLFCIW